MAEYAFASPSKMLLLQMAIRLAATIVAEGSLGHVDAGYSKAAGGGEKNGHSSHCCKCCEESSPFLVKWQCLHPAWS